MPITEVTETILFMLRSIDYEQAVFRYSSDETSERTWVRHK